MQFDCGTAQRARNRRTETLGKTVGQAFACREINDVFFLDAFFSQVILNRLLIGIQFPVCLFQIQASPGEAAFPYDKIGGEILVSRSGYLDQPLRICALYVGISQKISGQDNGEGENNGGKIFHMGFFKWPRIHEFR